MTEKQTQLLKLVERMSMFDYKFLLIQYLKNNSITDEQADFITDIFTVKND